MLAIAYKIRLLLPRRARQGCRLHVELSIAAAVLLPMKQLPLNDTAHWRERAEEARRIAEQLADAVAKEMMLDIARSYDSLAKLSEEERPSSEHPT
jgi:hypothetical protein